MSSKRIDFINNQVYNRKYDTVHIRRVSQKVINFKIAML